MKRWGSSLDKDPWICLGVPGYCGLGAELKAGRGFVEPEGVFSSSSRVQLCRYYISLKGGGPEICTIVRGFFSFSLFSALCLGVRMRKER